MYIPQPIDTSGINVSEDLLVLTEKIAENVHNVWATGRMKDGWKYGPVRDDSKKETPCLVPYSELSDREKEYDRNTALETIKMVLSFGYTIEKK